MFDVAGVYTKLVNWNKESWLSFALLVVLAETELENHLIHVGRCGAGHNARKLKHGI